MNLPLVIAVYVIVILGMSIVFLKLTERLRDRREQRLYDKLKREHPERVFGTPEYNARFDHPDFAAIEAHIKRPLPQELKRLYADSATMRSQFFAVIPPDSNEPDDNHPIGCFFPADANAITDLWSDEFLEANQIPFATDGDSGLYCVEFQGVEDQDPPVYFDYHDRNCFSKIAESLSEFLSWRRVAIDCL